VRDDLRFSLVARGGRWGAQRFERELRSPFLIVPGSGQAKLQPSPEDAARASSIRSAAELLGKIVERRP